MELHRQPGCWLRSSHTFKECVIAHWSSGPGLKRDTEAMDARKRVVEERSVGAEAVSRGTVDRTEERMPV